MWTSTTRATPPCLLIPGQVRLATSTVRPTVIGSELWFAAVVVAVEVDDDIRLLLGAVASLLVATTIAYDRSLDSVDHF